MPKIDLASAPTRVGTGYPPPFNAPCEGRHRTKLGDAAGLSQFGVNLLRLPPGQWSSQRHWHTAEDEFTWVVEGEVVLVENEGETVLKAGDCAGFKAGVANGHHFQNRSDRDVLLLEIGSRKPGEDGCDYPDIDLVLREGESDYRHRDGTPYDTETGRTR
jgi:uncharacterized cupin superfamily protein